MRKLRLFAFISCLLLSAARLPCEELKALFRFPLGGLLVTPPLASGGMVYLLSENRTLYGMGGEGSLRFTAKIGNNPGRLAKGALGQIFFIGQGGRISALNGLGAEAFSFSSGSDPIGSPLQTGEGRIFLASGKSLDCFSSVGLRKWSFPLESSPASEPALTPEGGLVACLLDGTVICLSPFGEIRYKITGPSRATAIALSGSFLAAGFEDGSIIILDEFGGEKARLRRGFVAMRLQALFDGVGGNFVCLSGDGVLSAFDSGGSGLWTRDFSGEKPELVDTKERRIYLFSKSLVLALDPEGNTLRRIGLEHAYSLPGISAEGIVYSGGEDWILYAYRFDDARAEGKTAVDYGLSALRYPWKELDPRFSDEGYRGILLDGFEKSLKSGSIGSEERAAFEICATIALEEIDKPRVRTDKPEKRTTLARSRACLLLGALGSLEARPILEKVFVEDPETAVRAQAARAIGAIGADPDGSAVSLFRETFEGKGRIREEQLARAVVEAIESIARFQGAPPSEDALLVLLAVAEGPYASPLRDKALAVMKSIGAVRR